LTKFSHRFPDNKIPVGNQASATRQLKIDNTFNTRGLDGKVSGTADAENNPTTAIRLPIGTSNSGNTRMDGVNRNADTATMTSISKIFL
jgi:hypothetical protein